MSGVSIFNWLPSKVPGCLMAECCLDQKIQIKGKSFRTSSKEQRLLVIDLALNLFVR